MTFYYFVGSLFVLLCAMLVAVYHVVKHSYYARYVVPLCCMAVVIVVYSINSILGLPLMYLPREFIMLDYRTDGKTVTMWAIEKGKEHPNTYIFPFVEQNSKVLREIKVNSLAGIATNAVSSKKNGETVIFKQSQLEKKDTAKLRDPLKPDD